MRAKIMVPSNTSPAKTVQSRASGAEIELVPGSRQDCADAAMREAANIFYASHNWHPFFLQGTKTLAYELWEDLGFRAPDNVIGQRDDTGGPEDDSVLVGVATLFAPIL